MNKYMEIALSSAREGVQKKEGGPFGALILDKEGNIISIKHNTVLKDNDPTAHAEINAIREACKKLETWNLSGCTLYTSCEPCPMCLSAIIWANINKVFYALTKEDANNIGFKDDKIYKFINGENTMLKMKQLNREECKNIFAEYKKGENTIY